MSDLEDTVNDVITSFINNETLFTALDVSNKVKELVPLAKHRDVRDLVRNAWNDNIASSGYARTPITVTLSNGSTAQALLYHPLSDSWDLDNKYNDQKRNQTSLKLVVTDNTVTTNTIPTPVSAPVPVAPKSMREVWQSMFDAQLSLFPRK